MEAIPRKNFEGMRIVQKNYGFKNIIRVCVLLGLGAIVGCQGGIGGGFPLQNATRVPPPGTGTFQTSQQYYNNTSATTPPANRYAPNQVMTASTQPSGGFGPATSGLNDELQGSNSYGSSAVAPANFTAPVVSGSTNMSMNPNPIELPQDPPSLNDTELEWRP